MSTIYVHLDLNYLFLSFLAKKKNQPKTTNQRKKKKKVGKKAHDTEFPLIIPIVGAKSAGCFRRGSGLTAYEIIFLYTTLMSSLG